MRCAAGLFERFDAARPGIGRPRGVRLGVAVARASLMCVALLPACTGVTAADSVTTSNPAAAGAPPAASDSVTTDFPVAPSTERVIAVSARRFEFMPALIVLKRDEPVVLQLTSLDRRHGFLAPDFHIDADIDPGRPTLVHLVPHVAGTYPFHCSVFCGDGHEGMAGQIVVEP